MYFPIPRSLRIFETPDFSNRPFVSGFEMTVTGLTTFTLQPGSARSVQNEGVVQYPSIQPNLPGVLTVDVSDLAAINVSGAFPIPLSQVGMAGNDTVFPILALADSTGNNATIAVVVTGAEFLPLNANGNPAYDSFVRVGQVYVDGTTFNIIPTLQSGHYEVRNYTLANAVPVLAAGAATVLAVVDLSATDSPITPGSTSEVKLRASWTPAAAPDTSSIKPSNLTTTVYPVVLKNSAAVEAQSLVEVTPSVSAVNGHAQISYINSAAAGSLSLWVTGWTDDMAVQLN